MTTQFFCGIVVGIKREKGTKMEMTLVFLFPAIFFVAVGFFAYKWNKAVKAGIFQKGVLKTVLTKKVK